MWSRQAALALGGLTLGLCACGPKASSGPPVGVSTKAGYAEPTHEKAIAYVFDPLDERAVSSQANAGKPTVIAFVATGDIVSMAQVDFLIPMWRNDRDSVNYAVVALHPRREIVLVEAYRKTLGIEFPVALGDTSQMGPAGPFGEIPAVPTIVILDRLGRLVWKHTGLAKAEELRGHMHGL